MVVKILVVLITTSVFAISANSETIVKEKKYNFESALYRSNSCSDDIEAKEYSWARISCAKEANENKHPMAFINTITLYAKGIGGEKDDVKALEFAKKGANHGHPHAMNILAHMYENGVGTNQSIEMALEWYLKAANGGFVDAYYNLGLLNEKIKNFIRGRLDGLKLYKEDWRDIFSDSLFIFLNLLKRGRFKGESTVTSFFIGIAKNRCMEIYRKHGGNKSLSLENAPIQKEESNPETIKIELEGDAAYTDIKRGIIKALGEKCVEYFRLKYWKKYSASEIAAQMGNAVSTAKNNLSDCRTRLRNLIQSNPKAMKIIKERL